MDKKKEKVRLIMKKKLIGLSSSALSPSGIGLLLLILYLTGNLKDCNNETTSTGGTGGDGGSGADGGTGGTAGSGGTGAEAGSAGMAGTGGTAGSGGTTGSGGVADCYPTNDDLTAALCAGVGSCKCHDMTDTMPAGSVCPYTAGNTCTPGHAQCGCDLPLGTDYAPPDVNCKKLVNGDTWTWTDPQGNGYTGVSGSKFNASNQFIVGLGGIQPDSNDFHGYAMSGKQLYWNEANKESLGYCEGAFADDCMSATIACFHAGNPDPYFDVTVYYFSP